MSVGDHFLLTPALAGGQESNGYTRVSSTASAPNTMNIIFRILREIIVDHMRNIFNIQTTGSHICSHKQGDVVRLKTTHHLFTHALVKITM
ncbi:hypothetical protein SDC9_193964 [bioreactor metagenome]|uniref:Uncharacterized protein n=1 Tax=bioreactor metagenome TaxID=1076179 RepID=A0A645I549_9ZZZZ